MASYLSDHQIVKEMGSRVHPWNPSNVNPASLDLRLNDGWIDLNAPIDSQESFYKREITLYPNDLSTGLYNFVARSWLGRLLGWSPRLTLVLAVTLECIDLPDYLTAQVQLKTTPCRLGLGHPIAGWIDPGYWGTLTLMLHAHRKIKLVKGAKICQLVFSRLDAPCDTPYGVKGHYQGISGRPAKAWTNELQTD